MELGYIPSNPAARCTLPKIEREEPRPLDDAQVAALLKVVEGGGPFNQSKAGRGFKTAAATAGMPDFHFHSLRHTYAVNAIRAGDDIKTVQGNLGHVTAAFTLDKYGHVTERMKRGSARP